MNKLKLAKYQSIFCSMMLLITIIGLSSSAYSATDSCSIYSGTDEFLIEANVGNETRFESVILKKTARNNRWLLQLRFDKGLSVISSKDLTMDEHIKLIDNLLKCTSKLTKDQRLMRLDLQVDFKLVTDIYSSIVSSVSSYASTEEGSVSHKNLEIFNQVLSVISDSNLLLEICSLASKHGLVCDKEVPIGMNPIAFKKEYLGRTWSSIIDDEDSAIEVGQWFAIRLRKN
ncbi:hypothetical protein [Pseudoalteromonas piscicida]|uniref:Uncharacterized protein n=1 Tax=Pseudoalteromonas piscicida TaxID=43662 RepID=A0A2A5JK04_PSEO7|nr:hypothetical protein [Pseudoalteromonas piscicida]PCK29541.1 hypothetical protein CEX98_22370 [Pseudoalteromonas piscicida]